MDRRKFIKTASATVLTGSAALAQDGSTEMESDIRASVPRNISSFRALDWRPYFDNLKNGAILADMTSRAVHYWSEDESVYKLYPSSVPMTDDLTRRGRTKVVRLVDGPTWAPTPAMKKRNPEWPDFVEAGPDNPLGTHALYLSWQYYSTTLSVMQWHFRKTQLESKKSGIFWKR